VSTKKQADEGWSLEAQESKIGAFVGIHDELTLVGVQKDSGRSGSRLDRPGLQAALDYLRHGHADGLVVFKLDRLTRSVQDLGHLLSEFFGPQSPHRLVCVMESIDTHSAAGRLTANVLISIAQWEREMASERTRTVMDHKREKGEHLGGEPPCGYSVVVSEDGVSRLVPNDDERDAMNLAKDMRERMSYSLQAIADAFNAEDIPRRNGRTWTRQAIARLLE
jgi:DNA invertase Pin-like site-specific DNA recombinase